MKDTLIPGITHTMHYAVPENRTVPNLLPESPDFASMPEVLATGYLVGIIEWACIETLHGHLDDGELTLGTHVDVSHDSPTVPGSTVAVAATVVSVEGRSVTFEIEARDEHAVISTGRHRRGVIVRDRFEARLAQRDGAAR
ncbi:thioesterase family protein [Tsukamurella pseudospumae]|uniref:Thioesterase n=1 Tax=Tsukamurella pseudospumae TaxID=239498 RepID=A0A138A0D0_9ACTN|nr:thioesterase family protein [Tsukamurella pseudospumae]KXO88984.1 thioesterase [Tsukamurella pseudospumae]KXP03904.1 thioesterase [Tsukamurella pseudospumae]